MALKFKSHSRLKKVLIYGKDGTGKSTFAAEYCKNNGLNPVVIDIEDTNFTGLPIVDINFSANDKKIYENIIDVIDEIGKERAFDTIIIDGVSSLLELLVSKAKGMKKWSDRAERFQDILVHLNATRKNLIYIGQIDMTVVYTDEYQSSKQVIKINSLVNEKYLCYKKKTGYSVKQVKERVELSSQTPTTADKVEKISIDPVLENWVKTLCAYAKSNGKPCRKGVLIACAKTCEKLTEEERTQVIDYILDLPKGEVEL